MPDHMFAPWHEFSKIYRVLFWWHVYRCIQSIEQLGGPHMKLFCPAAVIGCIRINALSQSIRWPGRRHKSDRTSSRMMCTADSTKIVRIRVHEWMACIDCTGIARARAARRRAHACSGICVINDHDRTDSNRALHGLGLMWPEGQLVSIRALACWDINTSTLSCPARARAAWAVHNIISIILSSLLNRRLDLSTELGTTYQSGRH